MIRWILALTMTLMASDLYGRQKSDVIQVDNGDRITGEIRGLENGYLQVKTDVMGTIRIEWPHVQRIDSEYQFQLEDVHGNRFFGDIQGLSDELLAVRFEGDETQVSHEDLVGITPIAKTFVDRIRGGVSLGASYNKGSDLRQLNLTANASYTAEQWRSFADLSVFMDETDSGEESTERGDFSIRSERLFQNSWYSGGAFRLQHNEELGLDLRTSLAGYLGKDTLRTSSRVLSIGTGPVLTSESYLDGRPSDELLEWGIFAVFRKFRVLDPELDLKIEAQVFSAVTGESRTRAELSSRLRYELANNLFWDFTIYGSFTETAKDATITDNDYGFVNSIGYSF